jgi:hypothetical protein
MLQLSLSRANFRCPCICKAVADVILIMLDGVTQQCRRGELEYKVMKQCEVEGQVITQGKPYL